SQLQGRNDLSLKPGVALEPQLIAWRGMNEGAIAWPQLAPVTHLVAEVRVFCSHLLIQITALCILTNQRHQLDMGHVFKQAGMPARRTFRPWRQVAGFALAGVTKPHRHNGDAAGVIEGVTVDAHPLAQALTAAVVPG